MGAATLVDARGMRCPWPVLRLSRAMRDADQVEILADDPQAEREIAALAQQQGWTVSEQGSEQGSGWIVSRP